MKIIITQVKIEYDNQTKKNKRITESFEVDNLELAMTHFSKKKTEDTMLSQILTVNYSR